VDENRQKHLAFLAGETYDARQAYFGQPGDPLDREAYIREAVNQARYLDLRAELEAAIHDPHAGSTQQNIAAVRDILSHVSLDTSQTGQAMGYSHAAAQQTPWKSNPNYAREQL
jgi:hypothetical protein